MYHQCKTTTDTTRISLIISQLQVFIIGPDKKLKLSMLYPATTGRNFVWVLFLIKKKNLLTWSTITRLSNVRLTTCFQRNPEGHRFPPADHEQKSSNPRRMEGGYLEGFFIVVYWYSERYAFMDSLYFLARWKVHGPAFHSPGRHWQSLSKRSHYPGRAFRETLSEIHPPTGVAPTGWKWLVHILL